MTEDQKCIATIRRYTTKLEFALMEPRNDIEAGLWVGAINEALQLLMEGVEGPPPLETADQSAPYY